MFGNQHTADLKKSVVESSPIQRGIELMQKAFFATGDTSLVEATNMTMIRPLVIVDDAVGASDDAETLIKSSEAIFVGYYMQAFYLLSNQHVTEFYRQLETINPTDHSPWLRPGYSNAFRNFGNEDINTFRESSWKCSTSAYKYRLPTRKAMLALESVEEITLSPQEEAIWTAGRDEGFSTGYDSAMDRGFGKGHEKGFTSGRQAGISEGEKIAKAKLEAANKNNAPGGDSIGSHKGIVGGRASGEPVVEKINLAVGRIIELTMQVRSNEGKLVDVKMPVAIRTDVREMLGNNLAVIATQTKDAVDLFTRFGMLRRGEISFLQDFVLMEDIFSKRKKLLTADASGVYADILRQANIKRVAGVSGINRVSVNMHSNAMIISKATAQAIELELGGPLSSRNIREKVMAGMYCYLLVVYDPEWANATFYHKGVEGRQVATIAHLKGASKKDGLDPMDIMRSLMVGRAPAL